MVEELIRKQQELKVGDEEFARELGISRTLWNLIRRGKRGMSGNVKVLAARRFADLRPAIKREMGLDDEE